MSISSRHNSQPNQMIAQWRRCIWVFIGVILLSSIIGLAHDHNAHKAQEAFDCAICQHAVSYDKTLPSDSPALTLSSGIAALIALACISFISSPQLHFRSRAPPRSLQA
jgi:hypothetical protein